MKAYNEAWIWNRAILVQAERWHQRKLLSDAQMERVREQYPVPFRQTNGFIEVGLFLFTLVVILACYLLPVTLLEQALANQYAYSLFNGLSGLMVGVVGQQLINRRLLYRNGIDNAFVVTLTGFLAFCLNQLLPNGLSIAMHCLFTLPLLLAVLWYYGDSLIAFFTLVTLYAFVFDGLLQFAWGKSVMPFAMMGLSGLVYAGISRLIQQRARITYYTDPLQLGQWFALTLLAASGNYFVVRELNGLLLKSSAVRYNADLVPEIDLPWLFWLLTFVIPAVYVWLGFSRKQGPQVSRMLLILGCLGLIAAVMTVHEYKALLPLNVALSLGGGTLIMLAVLGIRYWQQPRYGFTDTPDDEVPDEILLHMAAIATTHVAATVQQAPRQDVRFGGGSFGGGGSEGKY